MTPRERIESCGLSVAAFAALIETDKATMYRHLAADKLPIAARLALHCIEAVPPCYWPPELANLPRPGRKIPV